MITQIYHINSNQIILFWLDRSLIFSPQHIERVMNEHLSLITAMRKTDAAGAVKAMETHIGMALQRAMGT
jgi:DNA-binding GntR family transcriptional regulator